MKTHICIPALFFGLISPGLSQTSTAQSKTQQQDMNNMPGMQMNNQEQPKAAENPAQQPGPSAPIPELLQEVMKREPISSTQFQQFATESNPTLQQANAIVGQSAGEARQVGLFPNQPLVIKANNSGAASTAGVSRERLCSRMSSWAAS